jgi:hypothetical protein
MALMTISHDALSKLLFSSEILVRDLLLGLIEDEWLPSLDFTTLEKVPSEFVSDVMRVLQGVVLNVLQRLQR